MLLELSNLPYSGGKCHPYFNNWVKIDPPHKYITFARINRRPCISLKMKQITYNKK